MAAEVVAEGLAFAVQDLAQRPFVGFGQVQVQGRRGGLEAAEQRDLAGLALAGQLLAGLQRLGQLQQLGREPGDRRREAGSRR